MKFNQLLEIPASITGLFAVYFATRASLWTWLFGIIMMSLYAIIFWRVKLYADVGLQIVFLSLQFVGLYEWLCGGAHHTPRKISQAGWKINSQLSVVVLILFVLLVWLLKNYTDSTTVYMDALNTSLSLIAQWMMNKKWVESWLVWTLVNIISLPLYFIKHLYMTTGLYVIFFVLCLMGYFHWQKLWRAETASGSQAALSL